jgi:hypothetical protein
MQLSDAVPAPQSDKATPGQVGLAPTDFDIETAFDLIRRSGTISIVRRFLKSRKLEHSASTWSDMVDKRLRPALEAGHIDKRDVAGLLSDIEEHGNQHVFLFRISPDSKAAVLAENPEEIVQILGQPKDIIQVIGLPDAPVVASVKLCPYNGKGSVLVKIVERRVQLEFVGEAS